MTSDNRGTPHLALLLCLLTIAMLAILLGAMIGRWSVEVSAVSYLPLPLAMAVLLLEIRRHRGSSSTIVNERVARSRGWEAVLVDVGPPACGMLLGVALLLPPPNVAAVVAGPALTIFAALALRLSGFLRPGSLYQRKRDIPLVGFAVFSALLSVAILLGGR